MKKEEQSKIIKTIKCLECKKSSLSIYECGKYHCGYCLAGGMISTKEYRHLLEDKFYIENIKNNYVLQTSCCSKGHIGDCYHCNKDSLKYLGDISQAFKRLETISPKKCGVIIDNKDNHKFKYQVTLWSCYGKNIVCSKETLSNSIHGAIDLFTEAYLSDNK